MSVMASIIPSPCIYNDVLTISQGSLLRERGYLNVSRHMLDHASHLQSLTDQTSDDVFLVGSLDSGGLQYPRLKEPLWDRREETLSSTGHIFLKSI